MPDSPQDRNPSPDSSEMDDPFVQDLATAEKRKAEAQADYEHASDAYDKAERQFNAASQTRLEAEQLLNAACEAVRNAEMWFSSSQSSPIPSLLTPGRSGSMNINSTPPGAPPTPSSAPRGRTAASCDLFPSSSKDVHRLPTPSPSPTQPKRTRQSSSSSTAGSPPPPCKRRTDYIPFAPMDPQEIKDNPDLEPLGGSYSVYAVYMDRLGGCGIYRTWRPQGRYSGALEAVPDCTKSNQFVKGFHDAQLCLMFFLEFTSTGLPAKFSRPKQPGGWYLVYKGVKPGIYWNRKTLIKIGLQYRGGGVQVFRSTKLQAEAKYEELRAVHGYPEPVPRCTSF